MYRAVTWKAQNAGVDLADEKVLRRVADEMRLEMPADGRVLVDGHDVTREIRSPAVTKETFYAARSRLVRERLWEMQRRLGADGCVAEGRDMGTVVFPQAEAKFYLDARLDVRAKRRRKQLAETQPPPPVEQLIEDLRERDNKDKTRNVAPLARADDAVYVDTSEMTFDDVVDFIERTARGAEPSGR